MDGRHLEMLLDGRKTAVLRPLGDELPVGEPVDLGGAVVTLGRPAQMIADEAGRKDIFKEHRTTRAERDELWPGAVAFLVYPVEEVLKAGGPDPSGTAIEQDAARGGSDDVETDPVPAGSGSPESGDKEGEMPYDIEEREGEHCVVKTTTGEVEKCHASREEAEAHLAALRINVEAGEKSLSKRLEESEALRAELEAELAELRKAVTKSEGDGDHPASHYLVVEDEEKPTTWHLRVRDADGALDHRLMGAAWAATHGGYRGNKYAGPDKEAAVRKLKALYEAEGMEPPGDGEKARGEGRGAGGEPQGDGGAEACACPECGATWEHEKGTPCAETACPECGAAGEGVEEKAKPRMVECPECGKPMPAGSGECPHCGETFQAEEKAGRRIGKPMLERLKAAWETIKEILSWAQYEDRESETAALFRGDEGVSFAFKAADGEPWVMTWTTNAFIDRDKEILSTDGLERYVKAAEESGERGHYNLWHMKGTKFAAVQWQAVIGRYLVEAGPYLDNAAGRAAKQFFTKYPERHPTHAPEGWGCSPEFRYLPEERQKGVFDNFWITDRAILPKMAAANIRTRGGTIMAITKQQKALGDELFGEDEMKRIADEAETETQKHEAEGVAHKEAEADQAEPEPEAPEEEPEAAQAPEIDIGELAKAIASQFDVTLEPLFESVKALEERLKALEKADAVHKQAETPRFVLSLEKRASEARETALDDDDPLLKEKPEEADAGATAADRFLASLQGRR